MDKELLKINTKLIEALEEIYAIDQLHLDGEQGKRVIHGLCGKLALKTLEEVCFITEKENDLAR